MSRSASRICAFLCLITPPTSICADAQNPAATVSVDATANRHAISPNIYGVAYGDATNLADLNCPINRYGGNNTTRYNWQINADNRGSDWYFESIGDPIATAGERGDSFFSMSRGAGAQAMLTVPIIGWVAKLGVNGNKLASFSIQKYGAQTGNDWQWFPDAGNGVLSATGQFVTNNDFTDANVQVDSTYQQAWIQHLVNTWGTAANGGVAYYLLDNEHSIWFATHRDVHPAGPTMDEIRTRIIDYAAKIKMADPTALVVGPEEWGWSGYLLSGADQQWGSQNGWSNLPDRANHGGQDYLPWLLTQLKQAAGTGQPLLDVFSVHYYPQGGEFGNDTSTAMQLRRNRSTRSLWDPNYVDESWINDKVQLIPRLKNWVNTYYFANTPVAITEYNWGAESHINGATAQADILGIFGREGLDLAARWTTPDPSTPAYNAMKMYRNYDGAKSGFGDTSVLATVANPDNLSAFAAIRSSDGALTVMVINKALSGNTPVTVALNNFEGSGTARVYQLTAANAIQQLPDATYSGASLGLTVPAQSITVLILPKTTGTPPPSLTIRKTHAGNFTQGQQNATYTVTVSNASGVGLIVGTVTVTETVPSGLTLVSMSGTGWTCPGTLPNNCTRSDVLNGGGSYPPITVTVNVAANAASPQVNSVAVSGGGSANASITDSTNVTIPPVLSIAKTHNGGLTQGQKNATYQVTVSNANGAGPASGTVAVTETLPAGLALVSMNGGSRWSCSSNTCTTNDVLSAGASYPAITVTVNVAGSAVSQVTNQVSVSGGGSAFASVSDPAVVSPGVVISRNSGGCFSALVQGQQNHATTWTINPQAGALRVVPFWIGVTPSPVGSAVSDQYDIACYNPATSGSIPDSITLAAFSVADPSLTSSIRLDAHTGMPK